MTPQPSGVDYPIAAHGYEAVVTEVGATLRLLRHDGRDLVVPFAAEQMRPFFRGAVLAPWPNRLADGRYEFGGTAYQLPITEVERGTALHGLVHWNAWRLEEHNADRVTLRHRLHPQDGYPFLLDLTMTYVLSAAGLGCTLTAHNSGDTAAPYGCCPHPYLVGGPGRVDDWSLTLPAASRLTVDERLLPTGREAVAGTSADFSTGGRIGEMSLDHCYTEVQRGADGTATVLVTTADGSGVALSWGAWAEWIQVHTADRPEPEHNRIGLAVEPMSCPPDAFNSGVDVVVLQPGAEHTASWTIAALSA